jgi:plasmid stabilization system protein ParE
MTITWTPIAFAQAEEIAEQIALDNPLAAEKWLDSLFEGVERLSSFPESGKWVPEIPRREIREIIYGHYRVIYRIREEDISILSVRHGRRRLSETDV